MTFSEFKTLSNALRTLKVRGYSQSFIQVQPHQSSHALRERLELVLRLGFVQSEAAVAQGLIFPILLDVWAHFDTTLKIWAEPVLGTEDLLGNPDYVVVRTERPGQILFAPPYVVIVEAKQEKFDEGWGQCLAAMVAAQRLNQQPNLAIYGIVTTGLVWEFGKLTGNVFEQDPQPFVLADLDRLCGAVRYVFEEISKYPAPPPLGMTQAA
jgi:hypothetical protein